MKELIFSELTTEQKIGMTICAHLVFGQEDVDNAVALIRKHSLGAVWIQPQQKDADDIIAQIRSAADYPILIICDAENGMDDHKIPQLISLTAAGAKDEYARSFGRITSTILRNRGWNVVCNPVIDICRGNAPCGATTRTLGEDKYTVSRLSCELAAGCTRAVL